MAETGFARFPVGLNPRAAEFRPINSFECYLHQLPPPFMPPQVYYQPYPQFTAPPLPPPPPAYVSPDPPSLPPASTTPSRTLLISSVPNDVSESMVRRELEVFGDVRAVQMERVAKDGIVTVHFYDLRDAKAALVEIQDQHMQQQFRLRLHFEAVLTHNSLLLFPVSNFLPPSPPQAPGLIAGQAVWAQFIFPVTHGMPHGHNQGTIIIFNLDSSVSSSRLREIFEPFGAIKELRETPLKRHQRFIEFYDTRNAAKALEEMNGKEICGKNVVIQFSRPGGYNKKFPRNTHNQLIWNNLPRPPPSPCKTPGHSPPFRPPYNNHPQAQVFPKKKNSRMNRGTLRDDQLVGKVGNLSLSNGNGIVISSSSSRKNGKKGCGTCSDASSTSSVKQYNTKGWGGGGSGSGNSRLWKGYSRQVRDKFDPRFLINEDGIMLESNCMDSRTTLMIKNIPNKYSQKLLLNMLDSHCIHCNEQIGDGGEPLSSYDFVYLPIDFVNKCNVGYGFVNMTTPEATWRLYKAFHHQNWEVFNSRKICEVTYARLQGVEALKEHFKNSKFPSEAEEYMPVIFSPPRDGRTLTEPNPIVAAGREINHHHRHSSSYSSSSPVNSEDLVNDSPYLLQQNTVNSDSSSNSVKHVNGEDNGEDDGVCCSGGSFNDGGVSGDDWMVEARRYGDVD